MARTTARMKERLETPIADLISQGAIPAPKNGPLPAEVRRALGGRPTSYRPEFCQLVIDMANEGHTVGGIAGRLGVTRDAILKWADDYPAFAESCARAAAAKLFFWETKLIHVANTGGSGSQGQVAIFGVVNAARSISNLSAADWVSKTEIEHSGSVSLAGVVERMFAKLDEIAAARAPGDGAKVIEHVSSTNEPDDADFW